ncbi:MAG: PEP/pyruvate-binding domain-containing protein, partial [Acidobacteriota bacterium]
REQRDRSVVADFDRASFDGTSSFSRIGGGSFGGKARGLAFMNLLIDDAGIRDEFPDTRIVVPPFVVVSTDVFEDFLDRNQLRDLAINAVDDWEVLLRFAGVYATYMLANNHAGGEVRLERLVTAVKRVFASAFSQQAKAYLADTPYRLEEEKMAVILQQVVGIGHRDRFYPDLAGVARSHNFYPIPPMTADAGIAAVALGLGDTVVNGRVCVRFCPRYPKHLVQFSSVKDALQNSQRSFFGLQLGTPADGTGSEGEFELREFGLDAAEDDGSLELVGSTWSAENDAIYDGVSRSGVRLVSFAPILKHEMFPLAAILERLLAIATEGTSSAVEIEFAANLLMPRGTPREFGFLQLRPLAVSLESASVEFGQIADQDVVCRSASVLGNGRVDDLRDVIVVDVERFERARSQEVAREVGLINAELVRDRRPFLLIGVGRWGSKEPLLGIPVTWNQISGARVIVEAGFRDFRVTPSQGTHFFQNITAASLGYFTVNPEVGEGFVDWQWLAAQPAVSETAFVRHLRLDSPVIVKMHGRNNRGVILKPTRQG